MDETILQKYTVDKVIVLPGIEGKEIIKSNDNTNNTNNNIQPASNSKEETKDNNEVVKVEDTLAKMPLVLSVISISSILIGGLITSTVLLTKQKN